MGSTGKRRRRSADEVVLQDDLTPPVMWPDAGSGFEADPFSPAGMSQQIWIATGKRPRSRVGVWTVRVVCVIVALAFIAAQVAH